MELCCYAIKVSIIQKCKFGFQDRYRLSFLLLFRVVRSWQLPTTTRGSLSRHFVSTRRFLRVENLLISKYLFKRFDGLQGCREERGCCNGYGYEKLLEAKSHN